MTYGGMGLAFAAATVAGAINSVAGGGTLLSFPTLLFLGLDSVRANATNTMALWPASLAGAWGFRHTKPKAPQLVQRFALISTMGGVTGAILLKMTPSKQFDAIVPWLILGAAVLFLCQDAIMHRFGVGKDMPERSARSWHLALMFQFVVAVYGGYFGAGIGIVMLAALTYMRAGEIYELNFLKNVGALCINISASLLFGAWGMVEWPLAIVMIAGAIIGGVSGANIARRIGAKRLRALISLIGLAVAADMIVRRVLR